MVFSGTVIEKANLPSSFTIVSKKCVKGFFSLFHSDVPANITEARLKDRLEEEFEEGILKVERSGTCAGFEWTVAWETHGGDHPEMRVIGDNLDGDEVTISVETIQNGGLFLDPIPGEFLRTPHSSGQVSCLDSCLSPHLTCESQFKKQGIKLVYSLWYKVSLN